VILIVEDELLIRLDAADMIRSAGYTVVEAANADEAIVILESRFDITVVFTDIEVPDSMDGLKLGAAIRRRWPPIEIITTSDHANINLVDLPKDGRFFSKPYAYSEITGAIDQMIAAISRASSGTDSNLCGYGQAWEVRNTTTMNRIIATKTISEPRIGANSNDGPSKRTTATPIGNRMAPTIWSQPCTLARVVIPASGISL